MLKSIRSRIRREGQRQRRYVRPVLKVVQALPSIFGRRIFVDMVKSKLRKLRSVGLPMSQNTRGQWFSVRDRSLLTLRSNHGCVPDRVPSNRGDGEVVRPRSRSSRFQVGFGGRWRRRVRKLTSQVNGHWWLRSLPSVNPWTVGGGVKRKRME